VKKSALTNLGERSLVWRAEFSGKHTSAIVGRRLMPMKQEQDNWGRKVSYVDVPVAAGGPIVVVVKMR